MVNKRWTCPPSGDAQAGRSVETIPCIHNLLNSTTFSSPLGLYCLSWIGTSFPVACGSTPSPLAMNGFRVSTDLLEDVSNAVRDLLGGSSRLLVSSPSEESVNSLVWEISWTSIGRAGRLTESILLASGLAGSGGTSGALSGSLAWSRHDERYGF